MLAVRSQPDDDGSDGDENHFHSIVDSLHPVIGNVRDDQLDNTSPCSEYDARHLVNHLLGTSEAMRCIGAHQDPEPDDPWGTATDHFSDRWRSDLAERLTGLADAWSNEHAWEGAMPGVELPRQVLGEIAFVEVMLHGWDLARATGQSVAYDAAAVAAATKVMDHIGEMGREQGAFGERVEVSEHAGAFDRVLAEAGRDPGWSGD